VHPDTEYNDGYDGTIPLSPILMPAGWKPVLPDGDSCTLHTFRAVVPDPQEAGQFRCAEVTIEMRVRLLPNEVVVTPPSGGER
jgi:hypothetical protein